jgi:hypothetical protein
MVNFDPAAINLLAVEFTGIGSRLLRGDRREGSAVTMERRFRAWFGASATVAAKAWTLLTGVNGWERPAEAKEKFLWALMLLKRYETEENLAASAGGVDEKTYRKWAWFFVDMLSYLEPDVVSVKFESAPLAY